MSLTRTTVPLEALRALLDDNLPARFTVTVDTGELAAGSVTLTPVTSPQPLHFAHLVGADKARMQVQVTVCDATREACRLAGDTIRDILTGTDRRGRPLHPIVVPGWRFDTPTTLSDGRGSTAGGVHRWDETYQVVWQDRA